MMCLTCLEKYMALVLIACGENVKQQAYRPILDIPLYPAATSDFPDIAPSLRTER